MSTSTASSPVDGDVSPRQKALKDFRSKFAATIGTAGSRDGMHIAKAIHSFYKDWGSLNNYLYEIGCTDIYKALQTPEMRESVELRSRFVYPVVHDSNRHIFKLIDETKKEKQRYKRSFTSRQHRMSVWLIDWDEVIIQNVPLKSRFASSRSSILSLSSHQKSSTSNHKTIRSSSTQKSAQQLDDSVDNVKSTYQNMAINVTKPMTFAMVEPPSPSTTTEPISSVVEINRNVDFVNHDVVNHEDEKEDDDINDLLADFSLLSLDEQELEKGELRSDGDKPDRLSRRHKKTIGFWLDADSPLSSRAPFDSRDKLGSAKMENETKASSKSSTFNSGFVSI